MILANIKLGGSSYHRIITPLKPLGADFSEDINNTDLISQYKILWLSRTSNTSASTLSLWKEMFDIYIVYDMDDSLILPESHPNRDALIKANDHIKDKIFLADHVVVSTEELKEEFKHLNPNITVIPNRLPIGVGQFVSKEETKEEFLNRKINVGIIGSFYHYRDWKEIKGWLNILVKNIDFKKECNFLLSGYNSTADSYWAEFMHLGKVIKSLPVDSYMNLYKDFDIVLCPLVDNWFNRCKSSLKVLETGVHYGVPIVSRLYQEKSDIPEEIKNLLPTVYRDKEWFDITLSLINDKEKLWELKQTIGKKTQTLPFEEVVLKRKQVLDNLSNTTPKTKYQIYSIKYKPTQPVEYIEYFNKVSSIEEKSYLFEYNVLLNINIPEEYNDWVGVFSWKFPIKTLLFKKKVEKILDENKNYDCINFCRPLDKSVNKKYLEFTERHHKGFYDIFIPLCKDLEIPFKEPTNVIYSNFFVLKKDLYLEYVLFLKKAISLLETKYKDLAWRDANYLGGLKKDDLKKYTGLEYYTFHTFVLERLVGQWIDKKKLKVLNIMK